MSDSKTLLIIDDEQFVRLSLCDFFEDQGFNILEADSGEQAIDVLQQHKVDAAIVDIRMGGISGDEFVRQVYEQHKQCVFIICTGSPDFGEPEDLHKMARVSNTIFRKPVTDLNALHNELNALINKDY